MSRYDRKQRRHGAARRNADVNVEPVVETSECFSDLPRDLLGIGGATDGLRI